jgi:uncharacterized protein
MPRPRLNRKIRHCHCNRFYKPQGIPMSQLKKTSLTFEEMEVLRLKHSEDLDQNQIAKKMNTSQSTVQRILSLAHDKIAKALINGDAIEISE